MAENAGTHKNAAVFDRPEIFLSLGLALVAKGKGAAAMDLVAETLARHPDDPLYEGVARLIRTRKVPAWHLSMLRDEPRNAAYRAAIAAAAPGRVVLDIGTGSGLLAMIAAQAGAARVVACEANPMVAEAARRVIAANGLADRITVHACHSSKLTRADIGANGAELVVSEIFSADLVGEGVLSALDHARTHLAAPGARFLPEAACLRAALAEYPALSAPPLMVEGFDLTPFAALFRAEGFVDPAKPPPVLRSEVADLARMDWNAETPVAVTGQASAEVACLGGPANAILQWLRIDFGNGMIYENGPAAPTDDHWGICYWQLAQPILTAPSDRRTINAFYHTDALTLWAQ